MSYIVVDECRVQRGYTFWNLLLDGFLFLVTGGLWLIWIVIREIRKG